MCVVWALEAIPGQGIDLDAWLNTLFTQADRQTNAYPCRFPLETPTDCKESFPREGHLGTPARGVGGFRMGSLLILCHFFFNIALQPEILDLDILRRPELFPSSLGFQLIADNPTVEIVRTLHQVGHCSLLSYSRLLNFILLALTQEEFLGKTNIFYYVASQKTCLNSLPSAFALFLSPWPPFLFISLLLFSTLAMAYLWPFQQCSLLSM